MAPDQAVAVRQPFGPDENSKLSWSERRRAKHVSSHGDSAKQHPSRSRSSNSVSGPLPLEEDELPPEGKNIYVDGIVRKVLCKSGLDVTVDFFLPTKNSGERKYEAHFIHHGQRMETDENKSEKDPMRAVIEGMKVKAAVYWKKSRVASNRSIRWYMPQVWKVEDDGKIWMIANSKQKPRVPGERRKSLSKNEESSSKSDKSKNWRRKESEETKEKEKSWRNQEKEKPMEEEKAMEVEKPMEVKKPIEIGNLIEPIGDQDSQETAMEPSGITSDLIDLIDFSDDSVTSPKGMDDLSLDSSLEKTSVIQSPNSVIQTEPILPLKPHVNEDNVEKVDALPTETLKASSKLVDVESPPKSEWGKTLERRGPSIQLFSRISNLD